MINILVVEDDVKLNRIVCSYLSDNGYTVKGCLNPNEAYDLMYGNIYDLIISDIMMPNMDGYELISTLRESGITIPVLIITAKDSFYDMQRGFSSGTDD